MFKSQMILAAALLLAISLSAQQNDPVVLLLSSKKALTYCTPDGKKFKNVQPGALILKENTLKVPRNSIATLYSGGVFKQLKPGKYSLLKEMGADSYLQTLGFEDKFESYLTAAIILAIEANGMNPDWASLINPSTAGDGWGVTDPRKSGDGWGVTNPRKSGDGWGVTDPRKSGDGWGVTNPRKSGDGWGVTDPRKSGDGWGVTDPRKSGDGWGGKGKRIHLVMPFGMVLPSSQVTFSWSKPANAGTYTLQIKDANEAVVHTVSTQDTFAVVDLSKAPFVDGANFIWEVRAVPEGSVLESNKLEFAISNSAEQAAALKALDRSKTYSDADPAFRGIMEAVALERSEWFYPASERYAALKRQFPNNNLVRMMYATFWMRYGLVPLAHTAVKP